MMAAMTASLSRRRLMRRCVMCVGLLAAAGFVCLILYPDIKSVTERNVCVNSDSDHRLCVVVPFRDRFDELLVFVPHIKRFLCTQKISNHVIVVNQIDSLRFNRGSLINAGFQLSRNEFKCDYIAMHDVDLLPLNNELNYSFPLSGPFHVSAPELHPKYHYKTFIGGILLISNFHFEMVNGLSNNFWGWGREDDEFYMRLKFANLTVQRPSGLTKQNQAFKHMHEKYRRPRDNIRFGDQKARSRELDRLTGLNTTIYTEISRHNLAIDGFLTTVVNVELSCDITVTPWCMDVNQLYDHLKVVKKRMSDEEYQNLLTALQGHKINIS